MIGIFDSGIGGLSVWREIVRQAPGASTVYIADHAHVPYGPRPAEEIRAFCEGITRFLLDAGCSTIVVACNSASAAALKHLRELHPGVTFVGMEPAVKPAAVQTRTKVVGVLATPATLKGRMFALAVERYAQGINLISQPCPALAQQVEDGALATPATEAMLRGWLEPMLDARADVIVLACSHYPFLEPLIRRIVGPDVAIIDPAPAIARQVARVHAAGPATECSLRFLTTGDAGRLQQTLRDLLGIEIEAEPLTWAAGALRVREARAA